VEAVLPISLLRLATGELSLLAHRQLANTIDDTNAAHKQVFYERACRFASSCVELSNKTRGLSDDDAKIVLVAGGIQSNPVSTTAIRLSRNTNGNLAYSGKPRGDGGADFIPVGIKGAMPMIVITIEVGHRSVSAFTKSSSPLKNDGESETMCLFSHTRRAQRRVKSLPADTRSLHSHSLRPLARAKVPERA